MKRHLYGIFLFLLIVTGSILVYQYAFVFNRLPVASEQTPPAPELPRLELNHDVSQDTADETASDFNPEFTDLPNFEDVYSYNESSLPTGELTGVFAEGIYRNDEVVAKNGQDWLVLTKSKNKFALQKAEARVKHLKTTSWIGDTTDAKLTFNIKNTALFAIRNLERLKAGTVKTLYSDSFDLEDRNRVTIDHDFHREYVLNDQKFILRVALGLTRDNTKAAVLVLESAGKKQVVKQIYLSSETDIMFGDLYWVGDLDNDGKLDLYFDMYNEKGYTGFDLYLSSEAKEDNLVGLAASFGAAGC